MTGTATEEDEFNSIYAWTSGVPTNKPVARMDNPDWVYKTEKAKYDAIVSASRSATPKGSPGWGTISIEKSEASEQDAQSSGIPHNVLNAKQHDKGGRDHRSGR